MQYLNLAQIIHKERQAEIEPTLKVRRLLERFEAVKPAHARATRVATGASQTPAGAAS